MNIMIDSGLIAENFGESPNIVASPSRVHFSIFTKSAIHEIVGRFNAYNLKMVGLQLNKYLTGYLLLRLKQIGFYIPHHRIQHLAFMQPVSVKLRQLVFPAELPFGKHMFF